MGGLDFGYTGGSNEVKQELSSQHRFFDPMSDIEKGEGKGRDLVVEFFAVGDGGHGLLEVGLVVDGGWFGS